MSCCVPDSKDALLPDSEKQGCPDNPWQGETLAISCDGQAEAVQMKSKRLVLQGFLSVCFLCAFPVQCCLFVLKKECLGVIKVMRDF